ncbi:MAG: prolyl oligopeptidase family serine peptidase [Planctomycetes bacterium]|nr:prolyl oligopeptidase family serine peptidase [Planctomycetota bacterium]
MRIASSTLRLSGALISIFLTGTLAAQNPQVDGLKVFHRSGQTFLTWNEHVGSGGEHYNIYRVNNPSTTITDVSGLTPVFTAWNDSAEMYSDRWRNNAPRWVRRCVIADDKDELGDGIGLCVLTLKRSDFGGGTDSGTGFYVVTLVNSAGWENKTAVAGINAIGGIAESVADPLPVRVADNPANPHPSLVSVFIQYLDCRDINTTFFAPNPLNGYWGENPNLPHIANAQAYACAYRVGVHPMLTSGPHPLVLRLHVHAGNRFPDPNNLYELPASPCIEITPTDVNDTWWFGFSRLHDYRNGGVPANGNIQNVTEHRVLRMIHDVERDPEFDIDSKRIYVHGHSMGGSGALAFSMRFPGVFAAAYASKPMTNYLAYVTQPPIPRPADYRQDLIARWGDPNAAHLGTRVAAPRDWADHLQPYVGPNVSVWDWQNHQVQMSQLLAEEMVPLGIHHGLNDSTIPGPTQCDPFYQPLLEGRRAFAALVDCSGHDGSNAFAGMPPAFESQFVASTQIPFHGFEARIDQSVPGFSQVAYSPQCPQEPCSPVPFPLPPSLAFSCPLSGSTPPHYLGDLEWGTKWMQLSLPQQPLPPVDDHSRWEMSFSCRGTASYTVDITPRRLQRFQVLAQTPYTYENWPHGATAPVKTGIVYADSLGLLTIPNFSISGAGNRLVIYR